MSEFNKLYDIANTAADNAYAPYSNFKVGAALLCESGDVYSGCNIENSSYSLTCCAERVAIFKAVSQGQRKFKTFLITSDTEQPIAPCGSCRQVMNEFFDDGVLIILTNKKQVKKEVYIKDLLPYSFNL